MFDWHISAFKKHRFGWTRLICPWLYLNYQTQHSHMYNMCSRQKLRINPATLPWVSLSLCSRQCVWTEPSISTAALKVIKTSTDTQLAFILSLWPPWRPWLLEGSLSQWNSAMEGEGEQADGGTTHVFMDKGSPANPGLYPGLWESAASECCCRAHGQFLQTLEQCSCWISSSSGWDDMVIIQFFLWTSWNALISVASGQEGPGYRSFCLHVHLVFKNVGLLTYCESVSCLPPVGL